MGSSSIYTLQQAKLLADFIAVANGSITSQVLELLDEQLGQTGFDLYLRSGNLTVHQVHHALGRLRTQGLAYSERRPGQPMLWYRWSPYRGQHSPRLHSV
jgi:hypothetical protein